MNREIWIGKHKLSDTSPTYIVAELSGNHNMSLDRAKLLIKEAADAGADAVKLQTYTADTITLDCDSAIFKTTNPLWGGMTLYELYQKAYTPWEWHGELIQYANELGLDCFSSPFDKTAVDFLEQFQVPAYKIASFEINDIPLIQKVARTGKPIMISTGIAFMEDIDLAIRTCIKEGNENVILLKCVSAYPAPYEEMNLNVIPSLKNAFGCVTGLSDHSPGSVAAIAAVTLGARIIEKHFTLKRSDGGVDSAFSMEADEFAEMVEQIRNAEKALGCATYKLEEKQIKSRAGSRSLFAVNDIKAGETFTEKNIKSIRPGMGMHTKYYDDVLGQCAACDIKKGTPLEWKHVK